MKTSIFKTRRILVAALKEFAIIKKTNHNPPKYELPKGPQELLTRLAEIAKVFNRDMSFNGKSPYAEEYALCLIKSDKQEEALELFDLIAEDRDDLLFLYDPPNCGSYISEEVSPVNGKIGFEGIFQYAKLLIVKNPKRAEKLLLEIAEKIPPSCPPIHLLDVRAESIKILQKLGTKKINNIPIKEALEEAISHQY
ncbi:MAG: hypothetical protein US70_C0003G0023 [Parcubacteria group bacterium GW2011_GWD2_38_11]|nr:MAG: hypothetical protein US70_C0003G0023 [Parcubacteria group bacterium GW2011_GWD2_38_11]